MRVGFVHKFLTVLLPLFFISIAKGQEGINTSRELTRLTTDTTSIYNVRDALSYDLLEIERKGFKRVYDSIEVVYYSRFEHFYEKEYTVDELKQLLSWYKTPLGKRFAANLGRLYSRNLPELNSLGYRMSKMKKDYKEGKFPENNTNADTDFVKNQDIVLLFEAIKVNQCLEIVKARSLMDEVQPDAGLISAFEIMAKDYIVDLYRYFQANYSNDEFHELLRFYQTPLGLKVTANSVKLINTNIDSLYEWSRGIKKIFGYINMGKFQREHFRENKK